MKTRKSKKNAKKENDLLQVIDNYLEKKLNLIFWVLFATSVLFTFLLLNLQVSVGGDDAQYIIRANDFIKDFTLPSFQGPLYPIVLSIFIGIFGIKLFLLKLISTIFLSAHLYFFFKIFRKHISPIVMLGVLIVLSVNSNLLFYGGQTYSEAMFLFVQVLFLMYFFKNFITDANSKYTTKQELIKHFILGSVILSLGLVKSIGFASLFAVLIYFAFEKKWKSALYSLSGFILSFGIWKLIKALLWESGNLQFSNQASSLLQKHPYDASKGNETILGFLERFVENSNRYLSREFLYLMDLRPINEMVNGQLIFFQPLLLVTILVYAVLVIAFILSFKHNKYLMFSCIYLLTIMGITFVILQTIWESSRLMISFFPLLILSLFAGLYYLLKMKKLRFLQFTLPIIIVTVFLTSFKASLNKIKDNQKIFQKHLRGNITAGMTQDWKSYVNMCQWAAENIDKNKNIACRKPGIAFIYTGRRFKGIYKVPSKNPDTLLNNLYEQNINYVIMANLRKYKAKKTKYTINTIKRYLYYTSQKYPDLIVSMKQIGSDEPAYLFEIKDSAK